MRLSKVTLTGLVLLVGVAATPGGTPPPWPDVFDTRLKEAFRDSPPLSETPYDLTLSYLMTSFVDRQRAEGSRADLPGAPSSHGADIDAMEGFTRLAPVVAAWLSSGRSRQITDFRGRAIDLVDWLRRGIVSGTSPDSPGYWGELRDLDQRIVEAADVARALWIAREFLLPTLSQGEKERVGGWLTQANHVRVSDNNWHLFPVLINEVLASLNLLEGAPDARQHFERFMSFRLGQGWYSDGPNRAEVDWYNAWGMHYELWWLRRISPGYGGAEVEGDIHTFIQSLAFLIGNEGIPIFGRSVCYRMAAPAPLIAAAIPGPDHDVEIDPGQARHAMDSVWKYFIARRAMENGVITQGYCGPDMRVLDNYSGPSSCLWSLRSLVMAFMAAPTAAFWTAPKKALPVERSSYDIKVPNLGWRIIGDHASGEIRIIRSGADESTSPDLGALEPHGWSRRIAEHILGKPFRPANFRAKYHLPVYSSKNTFCGCMGPY